MDNLLEKINKKTAEIVQSVSTNATTVATDDKTENKIDDAIDISQTSIGVETKPEVKTETVVSTDEKRVVSTDVMDFEFAVETEKKEEITNTEQLYNELKKMFNTEFKSPEDVIKLGEKFKGLEEKGKQFEEIELKAKDMESLLVSLPSDIVLQIQDYVNGKDYRETIKSLASSSDMYSKPSESFSKEQLILMHNTDLVKEDLEDYDEKTINSLYKSAKTIHDNNYTQAKTKSSEFIDNQTKYASQYIESVGKTINELQKKFPNIKGNTITELQQTLKKGINAEIFDSKGTYKDNAAELYMFGKHGLKVIEQLKSEFQKELTRKIKEAESKAKEEIVSEQTNDRITKTTSVSESANIKDVLKQNMPYLSS